MVYNCAKRLIRILYIYNAGASSFRIRQSAGEKDYSAVEKNEMCSFAIKRDGPLCLSAKLRRHRAGLLYSMGSK